MCKYSSAEICLGLAPGLEDATLRSQLGVDGLALDLSRTIPITLHNGSEHTLALRLYSLREPRACIVEILENESDIEGFKRVKLVFNPTASSPRAAPVDKQAPEPTPAVVGFLIALGLSPAQEPHFFKTVIPEFLKHSWSSFPQLLREVGCADPEPSQAA